jgi:hypothetical protein
MTWDFTRSLKFHSKSLRDLISSKLSSISIIELTFSICILRQGSFFDHNLRALLTFFELSIYPICTVGVGHRVVPSILDNIYESTVPKPIIFKSKNFGSWEFCPNRNHTRDMVRSRLHQGKNKRGGVRNSPRTRGEKPVKSFKQRDFLHVAPGVLPTF